MGNVLRLGNLEIGLHLPPGKRSLFIGREEVAQSLPPYAPREAFEVGAYREVPHDWIRGNGRDEASYFFGVDNGRGMWFDMNRLHDDRHHVAVVVNIQGVNALTGPVPGQEANSMDLVQYRRRCPVHNTLFQTRDGKPYFCQECGFHWPAQNYLASNVTPQGFFWLDGFRHSDGKTRQFYFTRDVEAGVAAQTIGDDRVYAIGFTIFRSVEPKPRPRYFDEDVDRGESRSFTPRSATLGATKSFQSPPEIAAGALIRQNVYQDNENPDTFWRREPEGTIFAFYNWQEAIDVILRAGKVASSGGGGFLGRIKTGNTGNPWDEDNERG